MCLFLSYAGACPRRGDFGLKTLILYASKTGTTEKCAQKIKSEIPESKLINIYEGTINVEEYDIVIIGSPIRMGMIDKKIKKFLKQHEKDLAKKKVAYFICCGFPECMKKYYQENLSSVLLENAIIYTTFGGQMNIEEQKGLDKMIVKMVTKRIKGRKEVKVLDENIEKLLQKVKDVMLINGA